MTDTVDHNVASTTQNISSGSFNKKKVKGKKNKKDKEKFATVLPILRIKPENNTNNAMIQHIDYLYEDDKLIDEPLELEKILHPNHKVYGDNAIPLKDCDGFTMYGKLYRCNIIGSKIIADNRYPLMYLDVVYERAFVKGSLFQVLISIDIDPSLKKTIIESKKYDKFINLRFNGQWVRHIDVDDEFTANYENMLTDLLETEAANLIYKSEEKEHELLRETLSDNDIVQWIEAYVVRERAFYDDLMNIQQQKFTSVNKMREKLIKLCQTEQFQNFITIAMKCRTLHRRKQYNIDEDDDCYVVPKQWCKLTDIQDKLLSNNELVLDDD